MSKKFPPADPRPTALFGCGFWGRGPAGPWVATGDRNEWLPIEEADSLVKKEIRLMKNVQNEVSIIGLGMMGSMLAQLALRRGYSVTVWNRTSAKAFGAVRDVVNATATHPGKTAK